MSEANADRLDWIDAAKGLGILAVVAGHVYRGFFYNVLFVFHMPLFFFLAGYLYRVKTDQKRYLLDKIGHLMVPYVSFLVLLYIPFAVLQIIDHGVDAKLFLRPLVGGRLLESWLGIFWFVTCLFTVQQTMNVLLCRFPRRTVAWMMLGSLVLGYANSAVYPRFWLPGDVNVALAACPLFFVGHLARQVPLERYWPLYLSGSVLAVLLLAAGFDNTLDMKFAKYGIPGVTFLSSLCMIGLLLCAAMRLSALGLLNKLVSRCGEASMTVMYLHLPVMKLVKIITGSANPHFRYLVAVAVPVVVHRLVSRSACARTLLLGSNNAQAACWRQVVAGHADVLRRRDGRIDHGAGK